MHKIFFMLTAVGLQLILRKRITLLINLRHVQVVVRLTLHLLLLLLLLLRIELGILTERNDRWIDPVGKAVAKACSNRIL